MINMGYLDKAVENLILRFSHASSELSASRVTLYAVRICFYNGIVNGRFIESGARGANPHFTPQIRHSVTGSTLAGNYSMFRRQL